VLVSSCYRLDVLASKSNVGYPENEFFSLYFASDKTRR
jgi:hypothetical protein